MGVIDGRKLTGMRDDSPPVGLIACSFIAVCFLLLTVFLLGYSLGTDAERKAAIEAGTGRWVIDAKTGLQSFRHGKE